MISPNGYLCLSTAPTKSEVTSPLSETQFQRPCIQYFDNDYISDLDALENIQNNQIMEMLDFYTCTFLQRNKTLKINYWDNYIKIAKNKIKSYFFNHKS